MRHCHEEAGPGSKPFGESGLLCVQIHARSCGAHVSACVCKSVCVHADVFRFLQECVWMYAHLQGMLFREDDVMAVGEHGPALG